MSRRTLVNLVFFALLFVVMVFWALNNVVHLRRYERPYPIKGEFEAAVGVRSDSEVTYLGVRYGSVSSVERKPGGVVITMQIERDKHIPKGSTAAIARKSAIGEPYVDFEPPEDFDTKDATESDFLQKDDVIALKDTSIPLEFSELLRSASRLISGIDPDAAASLIHELSDALNGRADSLRQLTTAGDELSATFAAKTDVLDRLATNNTILTHIIAEHRASLGESLTNLRLLSEALRDASPSTVTLLEQGSRLFGITADLVSDEKSNLDCILHDLVPVIDLTTSDEELAGLQTLLETGPQAFDNLWHTRDEGDGGPWVRVNLTVSTDDPAEQYPPPGHLLPAVPAVPACSSTVPPGTTGPREVVSAADLLAGSGRPSGGTIAATGAEALGWLAAVLLLTAAAFRWLARPEEDEAAG